MGKDRAKRAARDNRKQHRGDEHCESKPDIQAQLQAKESEIQALRETVQTRDIELSQAIAQANANQASIQLLDRNHELEAANQKLDQELLAALESLKQQKNTLHTEDTVTTEQSVTTGLTQSKQSTDERVNNLINDFTRKVQTLEAQIQGVAVKRRESHHLLEDLRNQFQEMKQQRRSLQRQRSHMVDEQVYDANQHISAHSGAHSAGEQRIGVTLNPGEDFPMLQSAQPSDQITMDDLENAYGHQKLPVSCVRVATSSYAHVGAASDSMKLKFISNQRKG